MLAIYTRLSREDDESSSIKNQLREGIAFAKKNNFKYEIYDEGEGVSGQNDIKDRPELDRLMKGISTMKVTTVWFRNQNRLERSSMTFHLFASLVKKSKVDIYFGDKIEDWRNPSSFLQSSILTAINQYAAELQSFQTKRSLLDNVKEGKSFGIYPYGYKKDENSLLVIDEDEAEVVKRIYKLSLEGVGTNSIAEILNKEGVKTRYNIINKGTVTVKNKQTNKETTRAKKNVRWAGNTIRNIIKNTIYKGQRKWKDEYYSAPFIFEESYWEKVNKNLSKNRNNSGKRVNHKYLVKGLLECGVCNRNMYGRTRKNKKDHYYMCSSKRNKELNCGNRSINIDFIEKFIWEIILGDAYVLDELEKDKIDDNKIERLNREKLLIEKKNKSIQKDIIKINQLAIDGALDVEEVINEKRNRNIKITENELILKNLNSEVEFELKAIELRRTIGFDINEIKKNTPFNKRRKLIFKYISRVYIEYNKNIKYYYITVIFKTKTGGQTYGFSSNPHRIKRFVETGEYDITIEEEEKLIDNLDFSKDDLITEYIRKNERVSRSNAKR